MKQEIKKIVIVGAGNVAWNLAKKLQVKQCYARNLDRAKEVAIRANAQYINDYNDLVKDADLYIISVADNAIHEVSEQLSKHISKESIVVHTSGTMPMEVLSNKIDNIGVFYPLQTFTKGKEVSWGEIPLFVEGNSKEVEQIIFNLAEKHSENPIILSSEKRKEIHISAVLVCNFTNHLYALAQKRLQKNNISFELLKPLIRESVGKMLDYKGDISDLQTGPAIRGDNKTTNAHLALLEEDSNLKEIYKTLSNSIFNGKF
ncbi:MAG: DUF2520 domain-containing protein [Bacteroidetes bacterium]|nr:DUF2520 domain-containing protein [Bacteroidota bacterium]